MKKRYQSFAVGFLFILFGILLLVYWIILPLPSKQQLLQQILNQTITLQQNTTSNIYIASQYSYSNIQLSTSSSYYYIASNYTIGSSIPIYVQYIGSVNFDTNVFYGVEKKIYYFYFSSNYTGINITGYFSCNNGYFDIYINNQKIYSGCQNNFLSLYVPSYYLNNGENELEITFSPDNIFFNGAGQINDLNIYYLQLSSLNFSYYYITGNVYLYYDFCPYYPQNVQLIINNLSIPLTQCNGLIYLSPYLNIGENYIAMESSYPVTLNNVYIQSNQNIFYIAFPSDITNDLLEVVVSQGSGEIILNNNCYYNINSEQTVYAINISSCLLPMNLLAIKPNNYLYISYLQVS